MSRVIVVGAKAGSSAVAVREFGGSAIAVREKRPGSVVVAGLRGPKGAPGANAPGSDGRPIISADIDNRLKQGTDGGLHVLDDLIPDPLAYYILARS